MVGGSVSGRPVRVLYVRDHIIWGGGTIYFLETLPELDRRRLDASFCILAPRSDVAEAFEARGVAPIFLDRPARDPRRVTDLLQIINRVQPDLVHLSGPRSMISGRIAAALAGVPAIVRFNNALPETPRTRWLQRRLRRWTAAGVAVSRATRAWAVQQYGVPANRIEVIYSGHDLAPFAAYTHAERLAARSALRHAFGVPSEARVIGLAGRIVDWQKGQTGMIRALPDIRKAVPRAHLIIVGDGPDLAMCRELVVSMALEDAVTFTGERRDMPDLMAAVDLVVVPSLVEEAFGFAALEGAAAGLPVVAFCSGGLPEAVLHDETGVIVPKGDWAALSAACIDVLEHPRRARALGERGRAFALGFTVADHVEKLTRFHEQLAERLPRRRQQASRT